ncbi:hypothetical protein C8F01DRAFT_1090159 [Mycena amicta]|nr:hypothetical protein C8F01DRAFT_1090159 [Mycena amicta]
MDPTGHDSNAFYADAAADELPDLSLPTIDASSDEEDGSQRVILVPDDSPARPLRRPRPRTLQSDSLFKLRYIVGHPLDCVSGSDSPFTHLAAFIRIDCPEDMLRRFAGIADVAAEKILAIHEVAAAREQHRRMRAGIGASADSRDAPVAPGTFAKSLLPVPQLAAAMLDKLLAYVDGRLGVSGVRAYAVRVTPDDLYIGPVREPPDVTAILHRIPKEYICGICLSAKSHPVIIGTEFDSRTRRMGSETNGLRGVSRTRWTRRMGVQGWLMDGKSKAAGPGILGERQSFQIRCRVTKICPLGSWLGTSNFFFWRVRDFDSYFDLNEMVSPLQRHTEADPSLGRTVRREHVHSKRRIAKLHISRIRLPDLVEDWACGDLRTNYEVFTAAHTAADDFDESEFTHWLHRPPFDLTAIALAEDSCDYDEYSNWYVSCAVDGCLLRREQQREAELKEEFGRIGKKKMVDHLRGEIVQAKAITIKSFFSAPSIFMPIRRPAFLTRFFSAPPSSDDEIRLQDLRGDPELPYGSIRSVVDVLNDKHWQIMLSGRVVSVVEESNERYLVLEALVGNHMLEDFKEQIWALGRLQERTSVPAGCSRADFISQKKFLSSSAPSISSATGLGDQKMFLSHLYDPHRLVSW